MSEDIIKGKKRQRKTTVNVHFHGDAGTPLHHAAASANETELARPEVSKRDFSAAERREAARTGAAMADGSFPVYDADDLSNAVGLAGHAKDPDAARAHIRSRARELNLPDPYGSEKGMAGLPPRGEYSDHPNVYDRRSEPIGPGHASYSQEDHGVGAGRPDHLAVGHLDLRQSHARFSDVVVQLRTVQGDNQNGDRDMIHEPGTARVNVWNPAGADAGSYAGMAPRSITPVRPDWHTAPIGACNGVADPTGSVTSRSPASATVGKSVSNSEARQIMRDALFGPRNG